MGCLYRDWRIAKILTDRLENSTINIVKYVDVPLGGGSQAKRQADRFLIYILSFGMHWQASRIRAQLP